MLSVRFLETSTAPLSRRDLHSARGDAQMTGVGVMNFLRDARGEIS
jgi:hypothetical protein